MENSCTNAFPSTSAWGQQEQIKIKKWTKTVRRVMQVWKEVKQAQKKKKSQRPITSNQKNNNNEYNSVVFYKICKKF